MTIEAEDDARPAGGMDLSAAQVEAFLEMMSAERGAAPTR